MTEPSDSGFLGRHRGWIVERSLLLLSVCALVGGAAYADSTAGCIVLVVASSVCLGMVLWACHRGDITATEVLAFAIITRVLAFPLLPSLSDDGFRYVWDGWLQAEGLNPFLFRPSNPALVEFQRSSLYSHLNSSDYYSVYPPSSQFVFWLGGLSSIENWRVSWYVIKGIFVSIELIGLYLASRMVAPGLLILYAWHPLAIIEGAGQSHTEIAMVGFFFISLYTYERGRPAAALIALTAAGWLKLYPLVLIPFLLHRTGWKYIWVPVCTSIVLWGPYFAPDVLVNVSSSLNLYVRFFEFNAGPYYLLKEIGYLLANEDLSKQLGPLLQYIFILLITALFIYERFRGKSRFPIAFIWVAILGAFLATATTIHPWYLLGVVGLLPFALRHESGVPARLLVGAWLWLSLWSVFTYFLYTSGKTAYWVAVIVGWSGWAVLIGLAAAHFGMPRIMRKRAVAKWDWVSGHIAARSRLLDLGAGEGYVGEAAALNLDTEVILADIVDFNRTALPFVGYDGNTLPFRQHSFDATLLLFVLHHSADPSAVLHEVRRVTKGQVAVLESVIETQFDRLWLSFADRVANGIRSAGRMHEQPLNFGSPAEWRAHFRDAGFAIEYEERRGRWFHKQHLFVLQ